MIIPTRLMGMTRSGKDICIYVTNDEVAIRKYLELFDQHDHFDAVAVYQFLAVKALRKFGRYSAEYAEYLGYANLHADYLTIEFMEQEQRDLSLPTAFAFINHGKGLTSKVLID